MKQDYKKSFLFLSCGGKNTGSYLRIWYLARNLSKQGHRVSFLPALKSLPFKFDFFLTLIYYPFALLFRPIPDYLFIGKAYPNALLPAILARIFKTRVIIDIDDFDGAYHKGALGFFINTIQKILPLFADLITTHNQVLMEKIKKDLGTSFPSEKVVFLDQGVEIDFIKNRDLDMQPSELDLPDSSLLEKRTVVLYMAHMNVASEFEKICTIFEKAREKRADLFLIAAGGGPDLEKYIEYTNLKGLSDHIFFTGPFNSRDLWKLHENIQLCLVYYSKNRANECRVSMKAREHLCSGIPVICNTFAAAGIEELLITCDDTPEACASVLADTADGLADCKRAPLILKKAFDSSKIAVEKYSWEDVCSRFIENLGIK